MVVHLCLLFVAIDYISFNLNWNEGKPYFTLVDDGKGMTKKELIESFKLGSRNPNDERDAKDLGRFGCGMKTASLSQSKAFVVVTKSKNSEWQKPILLDKYDIFL